MDKLFCLAALAVLTLKGVAQADVELYWTNTTTARYEPGKENLDLSCFLNQDMTYLMEHTVDIYFRQPWKSDQDIHMFQLAKRQEANPTYYDINYNNVDDGIIFHFKILRVRPEDDGIFVCKVGNIESTVEIVVTQPLQKVSLQLDNLMPIHVNQEEVMTVEPGEHMIKCTAEGSNPRPKDVALFIGSNEIQASEITYLEMDTENRQYSASIQATVDIGYGDHHGKVVLCQGVGPTDVSIAVSMPIQVTTRAAKINCTNTRTYPGKTMVSIKCKVSHEGVRVDYFKYKITGSGGKTSINIPAGDTKKVNGKDVKVQSKSLGGEATEVELIFQEVQSRDFDSKIHLVVESAGGYLDEGSQVKLIKIPGVPKFTGGDNDSSSMLTASLVTVLLAYVLAKVL